MPESGDHFGEFILRRELGRGAMGVVWEAWQAGLNRSVALKVLNEGVGSDPVWLARFKAEAAQAAKLSHPGILPVYGVGETAGLHWFAMEKVDGEDLARRLQVRGPFAFDEAARYARDAARALQHAHERGVIHRDIKPANLMLRQDGRIALTDFGVSKELGSGGLTTTGLLVGTPYYMSPELVAGKASAVGPPADVYGLGVTLYELLTGKPPFMADAAVALIRMIADAEPEAPSKRRPGLPRDLETITLTCLAKRPERRYASAGALAEDLERFLAHEPIASRRPGLGERLARFVGRHRIAVTVGALALVALVGVTVFFTGRMASQEAGYQERIERLLREADALAEAGEHEQADALEAKVLALGQEGAQAAEQVTQGFARNLIADLRAGSPLSVEQRRRVAEWAGQAPARLTLAADAPDAEVVGVSLADRNAKLIEPRTLDGRELPAGLWRFRARAAGRMTTVFTVLAPPGSRGTLRLALPRETDATRGMRAYGGAWFPRETPSAEGDGLERLLAPYLLDERRVAVGDYAAFLRQRPEAERAALTPQGWEAGEPPTGLPTQDPVLGLSRAQAEAYARSQQKRLPLDHELVNASAPARIGEVMREVLHEAKTKGAARPTPRELQALMKRAFAEAGERIERVEGLRGWDGRPEWAIGGEGPHQGLDAPWPRIEPLDGAGSGPRRPREMLERLPPALRLAR